MDWRTELFREADQAAAECDALLARMQQRRELIEKSAARLIYKQNDDARQDEPQEETMDAALADALALAAGWIGDEIGKSMKRQADDISARLDGIESRLDLMEERLDTLEGGDGTRRVVRLPTLALKGGRDAV
jgi:hypothetical protein